MSRLVEYVGFFHLLRDQIRESWTQFRSSLNQTQTETLSSETNFRNKVKERLERFTNEAIRQIDKQDQDFSHLKRYSLHFLHFT